MFNDRNAGRKPKIDDKQFDEIKRRLNKGESVSALAGEYGISRQALYKRLNDDADSSEIRIDYMVDGELCTTLYVDRKLRDIRLVNYASRLSRRAFGYNEHPGIAELKDFLENLFFAMEGVNDPDQLLMLDGSGRPDVADMIRRGNSRPDVIERMKRGNKQGKTTVIIEEGKSLPRFEFTKKDRILRRTDTDGFQMKAISHDRRHFVKSQAVMAGIRLKDWAVEVIASDICGQLSIPCIKQRHCRFVYEGREFDGVYSDNFELDGYCFISFERLLERNGKSSGDDEFISLNAIDKLEWCAGELAGAGGIKYKDTLKYMLDLAVLDCLVGNTDRHTRNFGLFYNAHMKKYEIPPLFDNGMGLFENDPYRDEYKTFDEAMNTVYVSPYGEDPFDMLRLLDDRYNLRKLYPGIDKVEYPDILNTPFALEYERRVGSIWQR